MAFETIEWDREKLYEQIWAAPLRSVAKEYGVSDVALGKICAKLQIPRPGVGYWRRKECGYTDARPALPAVAGEIRYVSHLPVGPTSRRRAPAPPIIPLKRPSPRRTIHPLIKQTKRQLAKGRADRYGRVQPADWRSPCLDVRVTTTGRERAIELMGSLVGLLEANGMPVSAGPEAEPRATIVSVEGEKVWLPLTERVRHHKRPLTPAEERRRERWPYAGGRDFEWEYRATGRFELSIQGYFDGQAKWSDRKRSRVEDQLEDVVRGVKLAAQSEARRRVALETQRRREAEALRLRLREQERVDRLKRNVADWEEAERIRAYLAVVEKKSRAYEEGSVGSVLISRFSCLGAWLCGPAGPIGCPAEPGLGRRGRIKLAS